MEVCGIMGYKGVESFNSVLNRMRIVFVYLQLGNKTLVNGLSEFQLDELIKTIFFGGIKLHH